MAARKNNPAGTRLRILEHAEKEFLRHGYEGAKLNQIVASAGLTKGSVFHHFSSKEDIAMQWLSERVPNLLELEWKEKFASQADPLVALKNIFTAMGNRGNEKIHLLSWSAAGVEDAPLLRDLLESYYAEWHEIVAAALRDGQQAKVVHRAVKVPEEAHMILSLAMGISWYQRISGEQALQASLRSAMAYFETLRAV